MAAIRRKSAIPVKGGSEHSATMQSDNRKALIFGIAGQDGAYLANLLLRKGVEVHGTSRDKESTGFSSLRALGILDKVTLHSTVLGDFRSVVTTLKNVQPRYIYNLAARSSVGLSSHLMVSCPAPAGP